MDAGPARMETSEDVVLSVAEIAVLIDNLKSMDSELRLRSVRQVGLIATAIGPQRTRDELLPFLLDTVDDEEEVQAQLSVELKSFVPLVGGGAHTASLAPVLEALVSAEDTNVREKATETLTGVISLASPDSIEHFTALFRRLCEGPWFTTRSVAAALVAALLRGAPSQQGEVVRLYVALGQDNTPMVRRAVASALKDVIAVAADGALDLSLRRLLEDLASDPQDSVRLLVAAACAPLARRGAKGAAVLPVYTRIAKDESWRVRYMAADSVTEFQQALDSDATHLELVALYVALLSDKEAEVRCVAAGKVLAFCKGLPTTHRVRVVQGEIMTRLNDLAGDVSEHTRSSLAGVIMGLAAIVGKDLTIAHLLPLFLQLLKDDCSDVRLNIISHLEDVNRVIGIGPLTQALLPAIQDLAADKAWRVRQAIIENIPLVGRQLGPDFFNEHLMPLCIQWLQDQIYAVRRSAIDNVRAVAAVFGADWLKKIALPAILTLSSSENFAHRLTAVFALGSLLDCCDAETVRALVLPATLRLAKDKVPNIRLNVAKNLARVAAVLERSVVDVSVRPALAVLGSDSDRDVGHAAKWILEDLAR